MEKKMKQGEPIKLLLYLDRTAVAVRFASEGEAGLKKTVRDILIGSRRERVLQGWSENEEAAGQTRI